MTSLGYDTSLEAMETWTFYSPLSLPFLHSEIYQSLNFSYKRIQVEMLSGSNIASSIRTVSCFFSLGFILPLEFALLSSCFVFLPSEKSDLSDSRSRN